MEREVTLGAVGLRHDYEQVFRDGASSLWRALYAFSAGRRDIADDAVAEAFARAMERDRQIRDPLPWIYRTAFRFAAAELRRTPRNSLPTDTPDRSPSGDLQDLMRALRRLSPSQRAAVFLHYRADLPVREVSRLMGTSEAAVRVHLHQGRRRLRTLLGSEEVEHD